MVMGDCDESASVGTAGDGLSGCEVSEVWEAGTISKYRRLWLEV